MSTNNYSYYGVVNGRIPGIYTTWALCQQQTDRFSSECHAGFDTLSECVVFMTANGKYTEDSINVFGSRGGKYTLQDWIKKHESSDTGHHSQPLQVLLPPETPCCDQTNPTSSEPQTIILQPILTYIHSGLMSGTADSTRKAVLGYFTNDAIVDAKHILYDKVDKTIIGDIKHRWGYTV